MKVGIRWMIRRDMPEVLQIEHASFVAPWEEEDFLRALRKRTCIGEIAEHKDKIVGFNIYELQKTQIYLVNFAVAPWARLKGVGRQMIERLANKLILPRPRRNRLTLIVRETNIGGQLFFRACGFRARSVIRGHYEDTSEDGYAMQLRAKNKETANG